MVYVFEVQRVYLKKILNSDEPTSETFIKSKRTITVLISTVLHLPLVPKIETDIVVPLDSIQIKRRI